jgi:hypothetical protein
MTDTKPYGLYDATVPGIVQTLTALNKILDKAQTFASEKKIEPSVLVNWRLAPDMFPLKRQIQIMTDHAKGLVARLAGVEIPKYEDDENDFAQLSARIAKTLAFIATIDRAQIDGRENNVITLSIGGQDRSFSGAAYAGQFVQPNFYFHATTAYAILRSCGVAVGKRDFLAAS